MFWFKKKNTPKSREEEIDDLLQKIREEVEQQQSEIKVTELVPSMESAHPDLYAWINARAIAAIEVIPSYDSLEIDSIKLFGADPEWFFDFGELVAYEELRRAIGDDEFFNIAKGGKHYPYSEYLEWKKDPEAYIAQFKEEYRKDYWQSRTVSTKQPDSSLPSNTVACPYCKSTNTSKISNMSRMGSMVMWGPGSGKLGKQWHCHDCKSDF